MNFIGYSTGSVIALSLDCQQLEARRNPDAVKEQDTDTLAARSRRRLALYMRVGVTETDTAAIEARYNGALELRGTQRDRARKGQT
jgi:hypothetical protein